VPNRVVETFDRIVLSTLGKAHPYQLFQTHILKIKFFIQHKKAKKLILRRGRGIEIRSD
jgi:hypothetical protein